MATPEISRLSPEVVQLEAGKTYAWCQCGRSKNQPWCDGSHRDTEFTQKFLKQKKVKQPTCACVNKVKMHPFVMARTINWMIKKNRHLLNLC